jgi:hypothetical protein
MPSVVASVTAYAAPFSQVASGVQSTFAVLAIVVGGLWTYLLFVRNRLGKPCAETGHSVVVKDLGAEGKLVHVVVRVKNGSAVMMSLKSGEVRLSPMLPLLPETLRMLEEFRQPRRTGESEVDWPGRMTYEFDWSMAPREIEPHESDTYHFDFVVPPILETFQIYSYFANTTKRGRDIGWATTTIHDVGSHQDAAS